MDESPGNTGLSVVRGCVAGLGGAAMEAIWKRALLRSRPAGPRPLRLPLLDARQRCSEPLGVAGFSQGLGYREQFRVDKNRLRRAFRRESRERLVEQALPVRAVPL